jgi:uncharacterized protein with PIN domain
MKEWRIEHLRATLSEMEKVLDERLAVLRVRLLEDMALASEAKELGGEERAVCPQCGVALERRGQQERVLTSQHNQLVRLERMYGVCPQCQAGFFPPR